MVHRIKLCRTGDMYRPYHSEHLDGGSQFQQNHPWHRTVKYAPTPGNFPGSLPLRTGSVPPWYCRPVNPIFLSFFFFCCDKHRGRRRNEAVLATRT
ncbi:hypothetical protein BJX63DRAFT_417108 [Aspergillus granulosus]|uniref:Uncharacterized protein n=1 Tax=Aspergillus granulosus TaxID=176169 RepID=A0ABR4GRK7_9EURO